MDDVHFLLRHAMTGAIFVIFTALGLWALGASILQLLPGSGDGDWPVAFAALAIIGFPMIGITIQGAHYCFHAIRVYVSSRVSRMDEQSSRGEWFADPARQWIAKTVREAIDRCQDKSCSGVSIDWKYLRAAPDDAFFVWLYHDRATPHMIEWARRRRSYYYLGLNWVTAALAGLGAAWLYINMPTEGLGRALILILLAALWTGGALFAAERMRRDADTMEAIWAASQIDPHFRECLSKTLPATLERGSRPKFHSSPDGIDQ